MTQEENPHPDVYQDTLHSESMRQKALAKRSVSKYHNNNFTAGYVPVNEHYLMRTGLRGRKTFAFWTLVGLLFILAVGNLTLTMTILGVLRLGQGMQSLELVPEYSAVKFFGNTELKDVYKSDGIIESFNEYPMDISAIEGSINVKLTKHGRGVHKLSMDKNGTTIKNVNKFEVKKDGRAVFSSEDPVFNLKTRLQNLSARKVHTNRISSPIGHDLKLESSKSMTLKGSEGTSMESSDLRLSADADLLFKSVNGSILLSAKDGVYLDVTKLPKFAPKYNDRVTLQYKICVCMPQGKLFKIPVTRDDGRVYCDRINLQQFNPCI